MKRSPLALLLIVLALGCSQSQPTTESATYFANAPTTQAMEKRLEAFPLNLPNTLGPAKPAGRASEPSRSAEVPRKIIYRANVDLLVSDVAESATKLDGLIQQFRALVAQSEIKSDRGVPRAAEWRVRVPVDRFGDFIHQVVGLGEPTKNKTDSDDITDKFFDFQVRIANKKVQVDRLQKIIKEQTGKISEILEAESELGRVTTELEEMEGTLKMWENQTSLATVNITMLERTRYTPPETPTFATTVSRTFTGSVYTLVHFLQEIALAVVAFTPWIPVAAVFAVPFWFLIRWSKARVS
jgi:hypothetical protein